MTDNPQAEWRKPLTAEQCEQRRIAATRHGGSPTGKRTRIYNTWCGIKRRCHTETDPGYKWYGARGITVCPAWRTDFPAFRAWALANGYADDLQIDRIDNSGDYCPQNCRWVSCKENNRNRGNNHPVGAYNSIAAASEALSVSKRLIQARLSRGWSDHDALTIPVGGSRHG